MKKMLMMTLLVSSSALAFGVPTCDRNNQSKENKMESDRAGRIKTASGLEYEIVYRATGDIQPGRGQHVTVHYTGWLNENGEKGRKFDSSIDRGRPFTFIIGVGQVIAGWDEGVMGMKVGEKRRLYIPAKLGYGVHGFPPVIPGNANLIFEVELLSVS